MTASNGEDYDIPYEVSSVEGRALKQVVSRLTTLILDQSENIGRVLAALSRHDVELRDIKAALSTIEERQSGFRRELQTVPELVDTRIDLDKGHTAQEALAHTAASKRKIVETIVAGIILALVAFIAGRLVK